MVKPSQLLGALAPLVGLVDAYADPEACTGICTDAHDPTLVRRPDGTYFRFSTGGRIGIHSAPDLTGPWRYRGAVLPNGSSIRLRGNQDLWVRPSVRPSRSPWAADPDPSVSRRPTSPWWATSTTCSTR